MTIITLYEILKEGFFSNLLVHGIYIENFDNLGFLFDVMAEKKFWYESDTGIGFLDFLEKARKEAGN